MDITNIFCQSLGVTSHAKTFLTVCRFRTDLVSVWMARRGYPFKNNCHPFKRLGLSVWKRLLSVRTTRAIRLKKLSPVRTAWVIRLKKVVIRSNGLGYPFEKSCHPFERLGISLWKNCYPFERLGLSVRKTICRPFKRLKLSVQR